jgi:type IV pilus assembly protein PilN
MIKINLLPFRAARKKENIKRQISFYVLIVGLLLVFLSYNFLKLNSKLSSLQEEETDIQGQLVQLDKTIKEISQLEKQIKEIKAKLAVIKRLQAGKTGPVRLLEEISRAVPKDKLWLKSFKETKGSLTLEGTAMDNETVALFMDRLEDSESISSVDLKSARLRHLPKYKLRVADFALICKTYAYQEKKRPTGKRGKRRRK